MAQRNPSWSRDELILALDLYFRCPPSGTTEVNPEIVAVSQLLNELPIHPVRPDAARFRNPNGVHMKMFNFLWLDPAHSGGLSAGSKLDREVWDEFSSDRVRLKSVAQAIRAQISLLGTAAIQTLPISPEEVLEEAQAPEGGVLLRQHKTYERSQTLARKKKAEARLKKGFLCCEVCDFQPISFYGDMGDTCIECHHTRPVSTLPAGYTTRLSELALVCANCHRMLHRAGEAVTIGMLRDRVQNAKHGAK